MRLPYCHRAARDSEEGAGNVWHGTARTVSSDGPDVCAGRTGGRIGAGDTGGAARDRGALTSTVTLQPIPARGDPLTETGADVQASSAYSPSTENYSLSLHDPPD